MVKTFFKNFTKFPSESIIFIDNVENGHGLNKKLTQRKSFRKFNVLHTIPFVAQGQLAFQLLLFFLLSDQLFFMLGRLLFQDQLLLDLSLLIPLFHGFLPLEVVMHPARHILDPLGGDVAEEEEQVLDEENENEDLVRLPYVLFACAARVIARSLRLVLFQLQNVLEALSVSEMEMEYLDFHVHEAQNIGLDRKILRMLSQREEEQAGVCEHGNERDELGVRRGGLPRRSGSRYRCRPAGAPGSSGRYGTGCGYRL